MSVGSIERDFAPQVIRIHARVTFDHPISIGVRSAKTLSESWSFDNKRVSLPAATRVSQDTSSDVRREVRTAIHEDDAIASSGMIILHIDPMDFGDCTICITVP